MDVRAVCMEEMRAASFASYNNLTGDQQSLISNFYKALDSDGNGTASLKECWEFLSTKGYTSNLSPDVLQLLDVNRNGILEFKECITLLYMIKTKRLVKCDGACGQYLWGTYFLCVQCYETGNRSFDLCCSCYGKKNYKHDEHSIFMDNYALLRKKWMEASTPPPTATPIQEQIQNFSSTGANSCSSFGTQENAGQGFEGTANRWGEKIMLSMKSLEQAFNEESNEDTETTSSNCHIM